MSEVSLESDWEAEHPTATRVHPDSKVSTFRVEGTIATP
jgi:hypothetical protein